MRTKLSIVFAMIATIVIGMGIGNHGAYAAKVTKTSFDDSAYLEKTAFSLHS